MQTRVLVLNDDPVFEDRLLGVLDAFAAIETRVTRSVHEAVAILMEEHFDAFIVESEGVPSMETATLARQHFPSLQILCAPWEPPSAQMSREASQQQVALVNGAAGTRRLRKEITRFFKSTEGHAAAAAAEGIDPCHSLIGNLNQFSAAEILQMACLGQRTGRFAFKSGRGGSEIYLHHGAIRHACYGTLEGEAAVAEIFRWRQGRFYFEEGIISQAQTVDRPWAHLLIDNLQKLDETVEVATVRPQR